MSAVWVCHDCDKPVGSPCQAANDIPDVVIAHAEQHDHWLYLHPAGNRLQPPTRSVHASDCGGVYLDPVTEDDGRHLVSSYRARAGSGAF